MFFDRYFSITSRIPIFLGILILILSSGLWYFDYTADHTQVLNDQAQFAHNTSLQITRELTEKIELVETLLISEWLDVDNEEDLVDTERYFSVIPLFYNFYEGYKAINWVNTSGFVTQIYPLAENSAVLNKSILYTADGNPNQALKNAMENIDVQSTDFIPFYQGGHGIAVYLPVIFDSELVGFFNVLISTNPLLNMIFSQDNNPNEYPVRLMDDNTTVYERFVSDGFDEERSIEQDIVFYNQIWIYRVSLSDGLLNQISWYRNSYIIIIGFFMAIFASFSTQRLIHENVVQKERYEEKQKYQEMMNRYDKMNALGTMAGGLAHDFNNLLMAIQGNLSVLRIMLEQEVSGEIMDIVESIESTVMNSKDLTQQILIFSRHSEVNAEFLDLGEVLHDSLKIFNSARNKQIEVQVNYRHTQSWGKVNYSRLSQSFINILNNAQDAIQSTGFIEINTSTLTNPKALPKTLQSLHSLKNSDTYFVIEIIDSGKGISDEQLAKIFDPFYTTKEIGKGTGLGLSIVYQYITSIGGEIEVKSQVGVGTKFVIYIPLVSDLSTIDKEAPTQSEVMVDVGNTFASTHGKLPKILLVEDEIEIAKSLKRILELAHTEVVLANDGVSALRSYHDGKPFDLIIADINLPGINGIEVAQEIREEQEDQPLVFITGFNEENIPKHQLTDYEILQKPFRKIDLLNVIDDYLNY